MRVVKEGTLKRLRICSFLAAALSLTGCVFVQKEEYAVIPDERAGPNLVIYFAEDGNTRRAARAVAQAAGGVLFDLGGKRPLPALLGYDTFFVGGSTLNGRIAPQLEEFLARTDFMDGRVIPFWTSQERTGDLNGEFEELLQGGRLLRGEGFLFTGRVKEEDIKDVVGTWVQGVLVELGLRQAAGGDHAEDMAKLFAAAYSGRFGPAIFQDGDWTLEMDGVRWYYALGRFLPQDDVEKPEDFRPHFLYRYSPEIRSTADEKTPLLCPGPAR